MTVKINTHSKCGCVPGKIECDTARALRLEVEHYQEACFSKWDYEGYIWAHKRLRCHRFEAHFSRKELNCIRQYLQLSDWTKPTYHPNKAAYIYQQNEELLDRAFALIQEELGGDYPNAERKEVV